MTAPAIAPGQRSLADWASLLTLVVCWGSSFAITKIALTSITPIWTVPLRLAVGVAIFLPIFYASGERLPRDRKFWLWMMWVSLMGTMVPFFLIAWGTQYIDTGVVGVTIGAVPIFTIAMAHFVVPGERATPPRILGFVVGFAGLILLVGQGASLDFSFGSMAFLGQMAIVLAALGYSSQNISARIMPPASPLQKTMAGVLIAVGPAFVLAFMTGTEGVTGATWQSLAACAALGVMATAVAGVVMFRLIASAGPSFTSLTSYLIPIYAMTLGVLIFGESVNPGNLGGLVLILGGIAISEFWTRLRRRRARG